MNKDTNDVLFEALLKAGFQEAADGEFAALPPDSTLNAQYPIPKAQRSAFDRAEKKQAAKKNAGKRGAILRRVAVLLLVAFSAFSAVIAFSPDVRAGVNRVMVDTYRKYTRFGFSEAGRADPFSETQAVEIGYVPEEFVLDYEELRVTFCRYEYHSAADPQRTLTINVFLTQGSSTQVDSEGGTREVLLLNHREVHLFYNDDEETGTFVIPGEKVTVTCSGYLSKSELIKIAENVDD